MVDTRDLKSLVGNNVPVRVGSPALKRIRSCAKFSFCCSSYRFLPGKAEDPGFLIRRQDHLSSFGELAFWIRFNDLNLIVPEWCLSIYQKFCSMMAYRIQHFFCVAHIV